MTFRERFWSKVDIAGDDDCWLWLAGCNSRGYGKITYWDKRAQRSKLFQAHRVAFLMYHRVLDPGLEVCHSCDIPPCVNPAHLFAATHAQNMADRNNKGRQRSGKGEGHGRAVLQEEQVISIMAQLLVENVSQSALARQYGVSLAAIHSIWMLENWRYLFLQNNISKHQASRV